MGTAELDKPLNSTDTLKYKKMILAWMMMNSNLLKENPKP